MRGAANVRPLSGFVGGGAADLRPVPLVLALVGGDVRTWYRLERVLRPLWRCSIRTRAWSTSSRKALSMESVELCSRRASRPREGIRQPEVPPKRRSRE